MNENKVISLGGIITAIINTVSDCIGFLQSFVIDFGGFQFSLFDFFVALIVLWLALSLLFPWFGEDEGDE